MAVYGIEFRHVSTDSIDFGTGFSAGSIDSSAGSIDSSADSIDSTLNIQANKAEATKAETTDAAKAQSTVSKKTQS